MDSSVDEDPTLPDCESEGGGDYSVGEGRLCDGGGSPALFTMVAKQLGTFPNPRLRKARIRLVGVVFVLCDEVKVATLVHRFDRLESESVGLTEGGKLTVMEAIV